MELYDYQREAEQAVRGAFASGYRAPLLVLPTGGGKTVTFSSIAAQAAARGKRVLLLAHRRELVGQISAALGRWDVPHGLISPSAKPTDHPVQVAMVQSLVRRVRLDKAGRFRFDLVIVDECHHATPDSTWGAVLQHNAVGKPGGAKLLGVSATPCRLDGKGLGVAQGGFFDRIIVGPSVTDLIGRGKLARPVVFAPDRAVDLSGVKQRRGDFVAGDLAAAMDQARLTGDAVEHYRTHLAGAPSIAFTVTVEHAGHVVEDFKAAGYAAAVLTGSTPDKERTAMIRDLGTGRLNVLASCNVVSEGTDIPTVVGAILLRPTASFALAMQQMGRALRVVPGKEKAIILDHAGNSLRHGLPTEAVEWSLDGVKRKAAGGDGFKPCFECKALVPVRAASCPGCGRSMRAAAEVGQGGEGAGETDEIFHRDGVLVELTPERRRVIKENRREAEKMARSVDDLRVIADACGYNPRWAIHRARELRIGV